MGYQLTPVRMAIIKYLQTINAGEGAENRESPYTRKIPHTEEPGGYSARGHKEPDTTERTRTATMRNGMQVP